MEPDSGTQGREGRGLADREVTESEAKYRRSFARVRRIELVSVVVFFLGDAMVLGLMKMSVGTAFLAPSSPGVGFLAAGALLVLAGAVAMIANWRCPRCREYLAQATSVLRLFFPDLWMRRCPHCGLLLR